jgi:sugar O-acyltransferase (sialic acid O-acetyltransferase NeuD family)
MDCVIIGAGGHGKVVLDILQAIGKDRVIGFLDADAGLAGSSVGGVPVLGPVNQLSRLRLQRVKAGIVAIGDNRIRTGYAALLREHGFELISAVHPSAVVAKTVKLGHNTVIAAGAIVAASARLDDSVILNTNCVVDHECEVECGVHVCPGALLAGRVRVGAGAFIGLGAKVLPCLTIGRGAIIGAGAVVLKDIPDEVTAIGVPARIIRYAAAS